MASLIIIKTSCVSDSLRGYLSLYLQEISAGVFVGKASARVRDFLWERCKVEARGSGKATLVYPTDTELGYDFKICGEAWDKINFEGIPIIERSISVIDNSCIQKSVFLSREEDVLVAYESENCFKKFEFSEDGVRDCIAYIGGRIVFISSPKQMIPLRKICYDHSIKMFDNIKVLPEYIRKTGLSVSGETPKDQYFDLVLRSGFF